MTNLSIVQEYVLLSLNKSGKFPALPVEIPVCVLAGGLIELLTSGSIRLDDHQKVRVAGSLDTEQGYVKSLFGWLSASKPMTVEAITREYSFSLTGKKTNALVADIGHSLAQKNCVTMGKAGILRKRPCFIPSPDQVDAVIQKIRAELLESGEISDETIALVSLLKKSYQINKYFSPYESEQVKARLKAIRKAPSNRLLNQMIEHVDAVLAAIVAASITH